MAILTHSENQEAVIQAVLKYGNVKRAIPFLPFALEASTIAQYGKTHPPFAKRIALAKAMYKAGHPDEDADLVLTFDKKFKQFIKQGKLTTKRKKDPQTRKVLESWEYATHDFNYDVWKILHPTRIFSEDALVFILAAQYQYLAETFPIDERKPIEAFLTKFRIAYQEELGKRGLKLTDLEAKQDAL